FFSSRRRHTISKRDWSSDVCSSDLPHRARQTGHRPRPETQTTLHHPHTLSTTGLLKVLPSSVRIYRYRYYRNRLAKRRCERENHEQRVFHGLLLDETRRRGAGPVPGLG